MDSVTTDKPDARAALETWRRHVSERGSECGDRASTKQGLVLPLLAALGWDVFDPFVVRVDTTGSDTDQDLPHPDTRVDYAVRRSGVPALLIACHGPDEPQGAAAARLRAEQCLAQSPAQLAAATDGRTWEWAVQERGRDTTVRWFHRTEADDPAAEDERVVGAYSRAGWDPDVPLRIALVAEIEDEAAEALRVHLDGPSDELTGLVARKLAGAPRKARRREVVSAAIARTMTRVLEASLAEWRQRDEVRRTKPGRSTVLVVETDDEAWHSAEPEMNQNRCLRKALDLLAAQPAAESVFAADPRMRPATGDRPATQQQWRGAGHELTLTRRVDQKATLINDLAKRLGVRIAARVADAPPAPAPKTE